MCVCLSNAAAYFGVVEESPEEMRAAAIAQDYQRHGIPWAPEVRLIH